MAANLYETLGISKDATAEQIRKAYRKKALLTHPDRLPAGSTPEDKKNAEEKFRQANHAYEVLIDEEKRKEYDIHGVWPPPEPEEEPLFANGFGGPHAHRSFHDPFHHHHHHHPFSTFMFTDPFELFNSIFGDLRDDFEDIDDNFGFSPFSSSFSSSFSSPFSSPFSSFGGIGPFGGFGRTHNLFSNNSFGPSMITSSPFGSMSSNSTMSIGGGKWASQSYSSTTINGVTETIHKRQDWDGNEHITKTYSDGTQVNYINGVAQPSQGYLTQNAPEQSHTSRHDARYLAQSQHHPQPQHHHHSQSHPHRGHSKTHHVKTAPKRASPPPTHASSHSSHSRPRRQETSPSTYPNVQPQKAAPNNYNQNSHYDYKYNTGPVPHWQPQQYNIPTMSMQHEAPPPPYTGNNANASYVQQQPASGPEYHRRRDRHTPEKHGHKIHGDPGKHDHQREKKSWLPHAFGRQ